MILGKFGKGVRWAKKVIETQYFSIAVLACVDGNAFANAASGLFTDPVSAFFFGWLCFSGVGCLTSLAASGGNQVDKALGVILTRLVTLAIGTIAVFGGVFFGYSYTLSHYIAMSVVLTVSVGIGVNWLPEIPIRNIRLKAPLVVMISAIFITLPFSQFASSPSSEVHKTELLASMVGLLIAVGAASLLDAIAILFSKALDRVIYTSDLRLLGSLCLVLLAIGPIGGLVHMDSTQLFAFFLGTLPILALRKRRKTIKQAEENS